MDELTAPLGQNRKQKPHRGWAGPLLAWPSPFYACRPPVFVAWLLFAEDRSGGEPFAASQVTLATETADTKTQTPVPKTPVVQQPRTPTVGKTVTIIDGSSGKRQDVVVPHSSPTAAN
jgi:hypothetical protein